MRSTLLRDLRTAPDELAPCDPVARLMPAPEPSQQDTDDADRAASAPAAGAQRIGSVRFITTNTKRIKITTRVVRRRLAR
jgi:hypothetical protein